METLNRCALESLAGGSLGACVAFGFGAAVAVANWYNPLGWCAAELAMVGAVGCFG